MNRPRRAATAATAALVGVLLLSLLLSGCATPQASGKTAQAGDDAWRGRLALRFDDPTRSAYFASFELWGSERSGELNLYGPLGTTVASLRWSPQAALLLSGSETRRFDSLDELSVAATGAALPIGAMFQWLKGQESNVAGWQSDLSQLKEGRLHARRLQPAPAAELRLILEP